MKKVAVAGAEAEKKGRRKMSSSSRKKRTLKK